MEFHAAQIREKVLPGYAQREASCDSHGGKVRVLFLSMYHLGWKTWSEYLERFTPKCEEMEAIHIHVRQPLWMKILNRELPKPIGRAAISPARTWAWFVRRHFARRILQNEFDAVFVNSQILAPGLIGPCHRSGTKLIVSLDVTGPAFMRDLRGQSVPASKNWNEERLIYEAANLLVPWSGWIAKSLEDDFQVAPDRIFVVPPTIDVDRVPSHQLSGGGLPRILFCGNDWKRKGGPRLLAWHQRYWADSAELHIVSARAEITSGLKNVINHGSVPHAFLLDQILPSASIFCLPTFEDMSPYAVSEAQAFGIPTVTSRLGGMEDLVIHGRTGYLIGAHDEEGHVAAVTELLRNVSLRDSMRAAAAEHAATRLNAGTVLPRLLERVVRVTRDAPDGAEKS